MTIPNYDCKPAISRALLSRQQRVETATKCLATKRAKDLFIGLAAIFTEAGVFWDEDEQRVQLEDDDVTIDVSGGGGEPMTLHYHIIAISLFILGGYLFSFVPVGPPKFWVYPWAFFIAGPSFCLGMWLGGRFL